MLKKLESYFEFSHLGTNWRTEILAGVTTFLTMAYIVLVNPAILADAGVPLPAVTAATCLSAAFGSILMGIVARYPIALGAGHGPERVLHLHRLHQDAHPLADGAGRGVYLRRDLSRADRRRHSPDDPARHSARTLRRGGQRHRPVHRVHRLSARGPGGSRSQHAGGTGQHPEPHRGPRALRPHSHGGARSEEGARLDPHRRPQRDGRRLGAEQGAAIRRPGSLDAGARAVSARSSRRYFNSTFAARSPRACSKSSSSSSLSTCSTTSERWSRSPSAPA